MSIDKHKTYGQTPSKLYTLWDLAQQLIGMREDFERRIAILNTKKLPPLLLPTEDKLTYIIIHAHNPEGYEISGIFYDMFGVPYANPNDYRHVKIYFNDIFIANAPYIVEQQIPILITSGTYNVKAVFNGITATLGIITFVNGTTTSLIFEFPRIEADITPWSIISHLSATAIKYGVDSVYTDAKDNNYYIVSAIENHLHLSGLVVSASLDVLLTINDYTLDFYGYISDTSQESNRSWSTPPIYSQYDSFQPINPILARTDFNWWFQQEKSSDTYPKKALVQEGSNYADVGYILPNRYTFYAAHHTWDRVEFQFTPTNANSYEPINIFHYSQSGTQEEFHLSSIPYNMAGPGF